MKDQVVGLKTLKLHSQAISTGPAFMNTPARAKKRRVFTEDEWRYLNTRPTMELSQRIAYGQQLIGLLYRPEMLNMTPQKAAMISSNLRYQIEAIQQIIDSRR